MIIYIVTWIGSTEDYDDFATFPYADYDKACAKFKELVDLEYDEKTSWIGSLEYDEQRQPVDERYELNYTVEENGEMCWDFEDTEDGRCYTYITLRMYDV